ncbi:MAG: CotH kinase family protein, partial [Clostridiales bacterium]|nr:CotH kinase family protein [Clostridiales bacterium]
AVYNVSERNQRKARETSFSFYETDGTLGILAPADVIAKGRGSLVYAQKSLAIHFRGRLGRGSVDYPFFQNYATHTFSSLVLRSSGQDIEGARIRDAYASRVVQGMHLDAAATRPVIVYVNGNYYGIFDLGEDQNAGWLEAHYGVESDHVEIIRRNVSPLHGNSKDMEQLRKWVDRTDFTDDANFGQLGARMDIEYFTDYIIAQTFMCNTDMNNMKYWRTTDGQLKWRPIYYDLDYCFAGDINRSILPAYFNIAGVVGVEGNQITDLNLFVALRKNASWRTHCAERYVEVICTYFSTERLTAILDEMAAELRPEMAHHLKRWGQSRGIAGWENEIAKLRERVRARPEIALRQMQEYFGISDTQLQEWMKKYSK